MNKQRVSISLCLALAISVAFSGCEGEELESKNPKVTNSEAVFFIHSYAKKNSVFLFCNDEPVAWLPATPTFLTYVGFPFSETENKFQILKEFNYGEIVRSDYELGIQTGKDMKTLNFDLLDKVYIHGSTIDYSESTKENKTQLEAQKRKEIRQLAFSIINAVAKKDRKKLEQGLNINGGLKSHPVFSEGFQAQDWVDNEDQLKVVSGKSCFLVLASPETKNSRENSNERYLLSGVLESGNNKIYLRKLIFRMKNDELYLRKKNGWTEISIDVFSK